MAAHRYWRMTWNNGVGSSNSQLNLAEFALRSTIGGANLITSSAMLSTNSTVSGGSIANLVDGNNTTSSNLVDGTAKVKYLQVDFGTPQDVVEIFLRSSTSAQPNEMVLSGTLEYSDDNVTWVGLAPSFAFSPIASPGTQMTVSGFFATSNADKRVLPNSYPRLPTSWPTGPAGRLYPVLYVRYQPGVTGLYFISGTVKIDDTPDIPVSRLVRLYRKSDGALMRETWSDAVTGAYRFDNLANITYFVLSHDHTAVYNAVIKDAITPELA